MCEDNSKLYCIWVDDIRDVYIYILLYKLVIYIYVCDEIE